LNNAETPKIALGYAWVVFALTFALMISDYMSRQVINTVFPSLKSEWALSDIQPGMLVSVVALTVGVMSFPISLLADRWGRVKAATLMAIVWGLATVACGLSGSFLAMFVARALVGLGESGYGGVGMAILLSVFPRHLHASVVGAFLAAALFGSVLGVMVGGVLASRAAALPWWLTKYGPWPRKPDSPPTSSRKSSVACTRKPNKP
jgi:MFS family permease